MTNHELSDNDITLFAETTFRNKNQRFGIKLDDRRRHIYLIGKTGMGKSTMMENMIYQDIHAGRGVALADPHGDFVEKILDFIPPHRINDVVYFNPADTKFPIAFNILEALDPETKNIATSGLIGIFKKLWADSWGPRLEYLLRNAILALMDCPDSTILGVTRVLIDKNFRKKVLSHVSDPIVKAFWEDEYTKYSDKFQVEAISPIQNKVGQFLSNSLIRNVIGQVKSTIDIRDIMDSQKILLMNLSKGRIGEDASALLGSMMITKIQLAAMERVSMPENERKDFCLYVDEFQNFATESFANILSEARKYRLSLTMTNQYIEQLDEKVQAAVFGNVGTLISFRVGSTDAEVLEKEFSPRFTAEDLTNITKYNIYIKLMIDGIASDPFSARGLPPLTKHEGNADKIIRISRERYSKPREEVEDKIARWASSKNDASNTQSNTTNNGQRNQTNGVKNNNPKNTFKNEKDVFEATCSYCGIDTSTSFKPDGVRPIFCKDCLVKMKNKDLIIEKNHKGEYVVIKEPGKKDEDWGVSLDSLKSGDNRLEELKKKLQFKGKEEVSLPVDKVKPSNKKIDFNKVSSTKEKKESKPKLNNNQKNNPTPVNYDKKKLAKKNKPTSIVRANNTEEELKKDNSLKPGQKIEF
jgi:CxxC-x17-CxxC domain-containing protein